MTSDPPGAVLGPSAARRIRLEVELANTPAPPRLQPGERFEWTRSRSLHLLRESRSLLEALDALSPRVVPLLKLIASLEGELVEGEPVPAAPPAPRLPWPVRAAVEALESTIKSTLPPEARRAALAEAVRVLERELDAK